MSGLLTRPTNSTRSTWNRIGATRTDAAPPELVWLDTSEGLDEFAPELTRSPLVTAAPATPADGLQSSPMVAVPSLKPALEPRLA